MDYCLPHHNLPSLHSLSSSTNSQPKTYLSFSSNSSLRFIVNLRALHAKRRPLTVVSSAGASHCDFSSLNWPLEPRSPAGKHLSGVLQNHRQLFHVAVIDELKHLADERDYAVSRMLISAGSDEAFLHSRIAQLKEQESQIAVQDVMYMLIFFKFSEIKVPLVPKLSRCMYNGRLEIWPSKDWELESIYDLEVLEMIKEHVSNVTGLRVNSSVKDNWAMTRIKQAQLSRVYMASILYGYMLKSASLRHRLESSLSLANQDHVGEWTSLQFQEPCRYRIKNLLYGNVAETRSSICEVKAEKLKCFLMGLDPEALQRCSKLKSREAVGLIESHSRALFGNINDEGEAGLLETDDLIVTSFSSLKRLVLEAVAFGSFLWGVEDYIDSVYMLKEN